MYKIDLYFDSEKHFRQKHFSLNKKTLDGDFSLGPKDFFILSRKIKEYYKMKGDKKFKMAMTANGGSLDIYKELNLTKGAKAIGENEITPLWGVFV